MARLLHYLLYTTDYLLPTTYYYYHYYCDYYYYYYHYLLLLLRSHFGSSCFGSNRSTSTETQFGCPGSRPSGPWGAFPHARVSPEGGRTAAVHSLRAWLRVFMSMAVNNVCTA